MLIGKKKRELNQRQNGYAGGNKACDIVRAVKLIVITVNFFLFTRGVFQQNTQEEVEEVEYKKMLTAAWLSGLTAGL